MWINELIEKNKKAQNTIKEIKHQPILWKKIWEKIDSEKKEIKAFFDSIKNNCDSIVLTGAGTSAYIGISSQRSFRKEFEIIAEPISTTHIVSHPNDFLIPSQNLLMISFARSGNSPESCAAVNLANQISKQAFHFIITCNENGQLAKDNIGKNNAFVFILPEEANDKSLAMTSSFTGMMLASILISRIDEIEALEKEVDKLVSYGNHCLEQASFLWDVAAKNDFTRAIFLGSGPLYGIAKESQLKMQELSDGLIICKHDSFLGLRHGPRAVIDENTFIVHHMSNDNHAHKYERDLLSTMKENSNPIGQLAIGENMCDSCSEHVDWTINFESINGKLDQDLLAVVSVVPAQLLALFKSIQLGLSPDNPSRNGAISRVVQGVSIYPS